MILRRHTASPSLADSPRFAGISRLLATPITLGGVSYSPALKLVAKDATLASWISRDASPVAIPISGSGADPTLAFTSPLPGADDDQVKGSGGGAGKIYSVTGSYAEPSTTNRALVVEFLGRIMTDQIASAVASGRAYADTNSRGWGIAGHTDGSGYVYMGDGTRNLTMQIAGYAYQLIYALFFYRFNGVNTSQTCLLLNGGTGGLTAAAAISDIGTASPASATLSLLGGINMISLVQVFRPECGAFSQADLDAASKGRFALLTGQRPAISRAGTTLPSTLWAGNTAFAAETTTRASASGTVMQHGLTANFPRIASMLVGGKVVNGMLFEPSVRNEIAYSENLNNWSRSGVTVATTSRIKPDGWASTAITAKEDSSGIHYITKAGGSLANTTQELTVQAAVRRISRNVMIGVLANSVLVAWAKFDLASGTHHSSSVDIDGASILAGSALRNAKIDNWGTSGYRVWLSAHLVFGSTAGSPSIVIYALDDSMASLYTGVTQESLAVFFGQFELGSLYPSQYKATGGSGATKAADNPLIFPVAGNVGVASGALLVDWVCPAFTGGDRVRTIASVDDGTANNRHELYLTADGLLTYESRKSGGTAGDCSLSGSRLDGSHHRTVISWRADKIELWDNHFGTQDTSVTPPASLSYIRLGGRYDNTQQPGPVLICGYKAFDHYVSGADAAASGGISVLG